MLKPVVFKRRYIIKNFASLFILKTILSFVIHKTNITFYKF